MKKVGKSTVRCQPQSEGKDCCETSPGWLGDSGSDQETRSRAVAGGLEDVNIFLWECQGWMELKKRALLRRDRVCMRGWTEIVWDTQRGGIEDTTGRKMLEMELPGKEKRGKPKRRFMDVVEKDRQGFGGTEEDAEDEVRWKQVICCGHP